MRLLVLTGFFGSGKTTFLLRALRIATRVAGLKTIIVQNELGRVGVDPEVFRTDGLVVKELLGGCICCDLSTRLVGVLEKIVLEESAGLVCVEASGLATPGLVRQFLAGTSLAALPLLQVNVLDAQRLQRIEKVVALPILQQGIEAADLCVVNKIDAAPPGFRENFDRQAREIRPEATLYFANLAAADTLPAPLAKHLLEFFLEGIPLPVDDHAHSGHDHHDHHGHPSVCAVEIAVTSPRLHRKSSAAGSTHLFGKLMRRVGSSAM